MTATVKPSQIDEFAELKALVREIKDLPTIPTVLLKLLSLTADSTSNAHSLAKIINTDQTISAKLLRLSNSAFYGCRGKVISVSRAIMVLGFTEVKCLALGMSVFETFSQTGNSKRGISIENLWKHSVATAALSKFFADRRGEKGDSVFTAGLLHDLGKVVFLSLFREGYNKVSEIVEERGCAISEAEVEVFKVTHNTIGEWLCRKWKMPEEIAQCVRYHSSPDQADEEYFSRVLLVHLANNVARKVFVGFGGDKLTPIIENRILEKLKLTEKDVEKAEAFIERERENIEKTV